VRQLKIEPTGELLAWAKSGAALDYAATIEHQRHLRKVMPGVDKMAEQILIERRMAAARAARANGNGHVPAARAKRPVSAAARKRIGAKLKAYWASPKAAKRRKTAAA
jgi:hypothetical protein